MTFEATLTTASGTLQIVRNGSTLTIVVNGESVEVEPKRMIEFLEMALEVAREVHDTRSKP